MKLSTKIILRVLLLSSVFGILEAAEEFKASDTTMQMKRKEFQQGSYFICTLAVTPFSNAMLVQKKSGWSIFESHYFRKKELLLHIKNCTKTEKPKEQMQAWKIL